MRQTWFPRIDLPLMITTLLMVAFGLIMVYSASFPRAYYQLDDAAYFLKRQAFWAFVGVVVMLIVMIIPYRKWKSFLPIGLIGSALLLLLVLIIGTTVNGSTRWLTVGPIQLQPSEFVKFVLILYLAYAYANKRSYVHHFTQGMLPPLIMVLILFSLVLLQPDLGTGLMFLLLAAVMVFLAGARLMHLAILGIGAAGALAWIATRASYRMDRVMAFRRPFDYPEEGFQLVQGFVAMANGGMTGTGLGQSIQKQGALPEGHTDFIFAIIIEELGIFGLAAVLGGYAVIAVRGFRIAHHARSMFGQLLAYGVVFFLLGQAIFNLAAVSGMMPITGITLPFISYGGSSLLVFMACMGLLQSIHRHNQKEAPPPARKEFWHVPSSTG